LLLQISTPLSAATAVQRQMPDILLRADGYEADFYKKD